MREENAPLARSGWWWLRLPMAAMRRWRHRRRRYGGGRGGRRYGGGCAAVGSEPACGVVEAGGVWCRGGQRRVAAEGVMETGAVWSPAGDMELCGGGTVLVAAAATAALVAIAMATVDMVAARGEMAREVVAFKRRCGGGDAVTGGMARLLAAWNGCIWRVASLEEGWRMA